MHLWDWRARLMRPTNRYVEGLASHEAVGQLFTPDFFEEVWGQRPRMVPWSPLPDEDWVAVHRALAEQLAGTVHGLVVDGEGRRMLAPEDLPADPTEALVVLRDVHELHEAIGALQAGFRAFFRCPVTTGLYCNAPGSPGFPEHHDAHHVFALQLVGAKRWWLGPAAVTWPERRFQHEVPQGKATRDDVVRAGRLVYLPPGVRHRAAPEGGVSVHLTFGVHGPRLHDLVESVLDTQAARDVSLRGPITGTLERDGVHWGVRRGRVAGALRQLADRLEARSRVLPEGTPVGAVPEAPVEGEWPVADGCFQRREPVDGPLLQVARTGAAVLVEALPEVRGVYAKGSVLRGDGPETAKDIDLLLVFESAPTPDHHRRALAALATVAGAHPPWDARPVQAAAVLDGSASPWVRLCLAADAELLAGEPVWDEPPAVPASLEVGVGLFREAKARFQHVAERTRREAEPEAVGWLQKAALRLGGVRALVQCGRFTRHPEGCEAWIGRLLPDLGPLAEQVRDDLYRDVRTAVAAKRAVTLGQALIRR